MKKNIAQCRTWRLILALPLVLTATQTWAFLYPYDFGSYYQQPRGMVNNAALLHFCDRSAALSGRLRSNDFQPVRPDENGNLGEKSTPTDGNAIEAEAGLCHHEVNWLTVGLFGAFSSFDSVLSTKSNQNPVVFPLQKTYLPVISGAVSLNLIENIHVGFAAQFFETIEIDARINLGEEIRATIDTRIAMAFNWNIGAALETPYGIFHGGYQPAFEADINFETAFALDLNAININFEQEIDDIFSLQGAIDYRPPTWQIGWIGNFAGGNLEVGGLISEWDRIGSSTFITFNDPLGITNVLFNRDDIILKKTFDLYAIITLDLSDDFSVHAGYAFFHSPIAVEADRRWAVAADIHSIKTGARLKTTLQGKTVYIEGQLIYGYMPEQQISGGGSLSGEYIAGMGQLSFPF